MGGALGASTGKGERGRKAACDRVAVEARQGAIQEDLVARGGRAASEEGAHLVATDRVAVHRVANTTAVTAQRVRLVLFVEFSRGTPRGFDRIVPVTEFLG